MKLHTATVQDDGTVHIPFDVARPGRTIVFSVRDVSTEPRVATDPTLVPELDRVTARTPELKRLLIEEVLRMGRETRKRLPESQRTSDHDWLYDEHGLPR